MRRKKYSKSGTIAVIAFMAVAAFYLFSQTTSDSSHESLKQPRITRMPDEAVLVVTAQGDPDVTASKAFGLLFKAYYSIPNAPKSINSAPRARWEGDPKARSTLTGYYALSVPQTIESVPAVDAEPGLSLTLARWEYGEVAEILHVGPYREEARSIEQLQQFVAQQGYETFGLHEEEYLKGPEMFYKGDPKEYQTIIRYRVRKK